MEVGSKIFLIGFMGSGKTTLGKKLAKKLNYSFFDLDVEIEKSEGCSINEIFEKHGEAYFRDLEAKILQNLISSNKHFVLSLGGGTPCYHNNVELINNSGVSIYLKYNAGILASRLIHAKAKRPLIKDLDETQLQAFVASKLAEREPYYSQAQFVVESNNVRIEDVLKLF